ncbi:hypothetical protein CYMTET_36099 [Cymbomonas tetramitiformis]|uniref:Uncharacterized protein n=1 Tax=Cymbomonas tetramitiformis TaxID=36881 RepID=A0AAE0F7X0_9CHLO|nr:hypothetical protein CYMTET_36099 [Cymbomonas tetramitiformis]
MQGPVQQVPDGVDLREGDEVECIVTFNPTTKKLNARKLHRTKKAPVPEPVTPPRFTCGTERRGSGERPSVDSSPGSGALHSTTGVAASVRIAKRPDDTGRGFSFGRGKGMLPPPGVTLPPALLASLRPPPPPGLNVSASEFVPSFTT